MEETQQIVEDALAFIREDIRREGTRAVDLHPSIDSAAADLTDLGHELAVLDTGRVLVDCQPVALLRALRNLQENASIHGVGAMVRIARDYRTLSIVIEDEGTGIPEADRDRSFEPFVRCD